MLAIDEQATQTDLFRTCEKKTREFANSFAKRKGKRKSADSQTCFSPDCMSVADIINVHTVDNFSDRRVEHISSRLIAESEVSLLNSELRVFCVTTGPTGFYIIRNALTLSAQLYWAALAVQRYSRSPHTNLTNLRNVSTPIIADNSSIPPAYEESEWERSVAIKDDFHSFKKLRWSSLGYHYDWTLRMYKQYDKSIFPPEFAVLCRAIANLLDLEINPEAGIVNYYPLNAQMCGELVCSMIVIHLV